MPSSSIIVDEQTPAAKAFSKQAIHFDVDDLSNPILTAWRKQIYNHVDHFLKPSSRILELNAGTGIDAARFAKSGHIVHATELSTGMIKVIERKMSRDNLKNLSFEQRSYENIGQIDQSNFDFVFSNFGGLNCCSNLELVTTQLPQLIKPNAFVTWVIMPPISLWELIWVFRGKKTAFRRLKKGGTMAHLEGEYFRTYYHSLKKVKSAFGPRFKLIKIESLGLLTPPPDRGYLALKYPILYHFAETIDSLIRKIYPFNRIGDHLIMTFQFNPKK
ncbi:MAG: class I SAM-dependent methyltransferase [Cyclobacteriaceae bacterium]